VSPAGAKVDRRIDHAADAPGQPHQLLMGLQRIKPDRIVIPVPFQRAKGKIDGRTALFGGVDFVGVHPFETDFGC